MPRLVKTVTEMEGRFEEKWVLVEEDGIVSWEPDGRARRRRQAGAARRAGRSASPALARYTVDVALPGMLHAAVLRSPVAHGRVDGAADRRGARRPRRARGARPRDRAELLAARRPAVRRAGLRRRPIAVVAADTLAAARAGVRGAGARDRAAAVRGRHRGGLPRPAHRRRPVRGLARRRRRGAWPRPRSRVELQVETPGQLQTPIEPHAAVALVEARRADLLDRDAGHLRRPRRADAALQRAEGARPRDRRVHRRRLRRQAERRASRR